MKLNRGDIVIANLESVSKGVENTIRNICRIGAEGMNGTDEEIIKIMTHCD